MNRERVKQIKERLGNPPDLFVKDFNRLNQLVSIVFIETVCDSNNIIATITRHLMETEDRNLTVDNIESQIAHIKLQKVEEDKVVSLLLAGFAIILIEGEKQIFAVEVKANLSSPIMEAKTEKMLKGPRDAFVENYHINVGLIRKRIKDPNLQFEELTIGTRSQAKLGIFYVKDIARPERIKEIKERIAAINVDCVLNTNSIMEMISPKKQPAIPSYITTERPDNTAEALLQGKICLMLENTPTVTIIPAILTDFIKVPDDWYEKGINSWLTRAIRYVALLITLLIIPLYIAFINFNFEIIPVELLMSITKQKDGLPFPNVLEVLLLLLLFEILRETDLRMSSSIGSALSIVGALIIGDAAVRAGIVSPIGVIVASLASITGLVFNRIEMVNALRWYRLILIMTASLFGLFGVVVGSIWIYFNLSQASFFNVPLLPSPGILFSTNDPSGINVSSAAWHTKRSPLQTDNLKRGGK